MDVFSCFTISVSASCKVEGCKRRKVIFLIFLDEMTYDLKKISKGQSGRVNHNCK